MDVFDLINKKLVWFVENNTKEDDLKNASLYVSQSSEALYDVFAFKDIPINPLEEKECVHANIYAIDGSNKSIISTNEFSLMYVRVVAYSKSNMIYSDMLSFAYLEDGNYVLEHYNLKGIRLFNDGVMHKVDPYDEEYTLKGLRANPNMVASMIRRYAEWKLVSKVNEGNEEAIILKDGGLHSSVREESKMISNVLDSLKSNNHLLCIVKNNLLITNNYRDLIYDAYRYVSLNSAYDSWVFGPVAIGKSEVHPAKIYVVKFHPRGRAFRIDIPRNKHLEHLECLMHQTKDALLLGYPYALVKADVESSIKDYVIESIKSKILHKGVKDYVVLSEDIHEYLYKVR